MIRPMRDMMTQLPLEAQTSVRFAGRGSCPPHMPVATIETRSVILVYQQKLHELDQQIEAHLKSISASCVMPTEPLRPRPSDARSPEMSSQSGDCGGSQTG